MHYPDPSGSWKQLPLALDLNANLEGTAVLRAAYARLKLSQRLTFEQVMSDRALAIGIRHLADAIAHHRVSETSATNFAATSEIDEDTDSVLEFRSEVDHSGADKGESR